MADYRLVELIPVEKFFYYSTLFGDEFVNGITITNYIKLDDFMIKEAMFYLYKRHPLLRAHFKLDDTNIYFAIPFNDEKTITDMNFERHNLKSRDELVKELERFSVQTLDYSKKDILWRLEVVTFIEKDCENTAFTITLPMNMTDGINITVLCIELINILNSLLNSEICFEMTEKLELLDDVKTLIKKHNLDNEKYWEGYKNSRSNLPVVSYLLPNSLKNPIESGYKINLLTFDIETTQKLVLYSKKHEIKVNSILVAAFFYSLKELYKEKGLKMPKDVSILIMVSLRFRFVPNIDFSHVRDCTSGFPLDLEFPKFGKYEKFPDDCKFIDKLVLKNINDHSNLDWILNDTKYIDTKLIDELYKKDPESINPILDNERLCDVLISNNGTWVSDRKKVIDGPMKIKELYYGDSLKSYPTMNIPFILHIHTFNNRLMVQLSSNRSKISSIHSDKFLFIFKTFLEKLD